MAGAANGSGRDNSDQNTDAIRRRLNELEGKLGRVRARHAPPSRSDQSERASALGNALRLATELVAGVIVGGCIGWALDRWFGTSPIMLLVFLILGSAAGILNVIRSAKAMQPKSGYPGQDLPPEASDEDD